nr:thiamine phosphate synthase [uncultured Oscillibacter sp.]
MRCDRRHMRLYAVTDRAWLGSRTLCEQVEAALKGGVTCVQLREKELEEAAFLREARELSALCRRYGVPFLVNDNVDIALASGADGVHVGQEDMDPAQVRLRAGKDMLLGVSVHTVEEAREAVRKGADYLGVGAMFPTGTKADAERVPRQILRDICAAVDVPVVAIGGMNRESIPRLSGSGVDGVALVSAIFSAEDIEGACRELLALSERLAEPPHGGQSQGGGKEKAR